MNRGARLATIGAVAIALSLAASPARAASKFKRAPKKRSKKRIAPLATSAAKELEALAHGIASEAGRKSREIQEAIGFIIRQQARNAGRSIYDMSYPWRSQGYKDSRGLTSKWASIKDPTEAHRRVAARVLATPLSASPVRGARRFFEANVQDAAFRAGERYDRLKSAGRSDAWIKANDKQAYRLRKYNYDAAGIRRKWGREGLSLKKKIGQWEFFGGVFELEAPVFGIPVVPTAPGLAVASRTATPDASRRAAQSGYRRARGVNPVLIVAGGIGVASVAALALGGR